MSPILQATEYIVSQTKNNIQFLQSVNQISSEDARQILSKLPGSDHNLSSPSSNFPLVSPPLLPPRPGAFNYRALWSYNGNGQDAKDLTFSAGDVIEVIGKSDPNWWMGRFNGREGLFPSSYVVLDTPQPQIHSPPPRYFTSLPTGPHSYPQQPQFGGPPPPPGNMYPPNPMPFQGSYPPSQGPPPRPVVVTANNEHVQPPKKQGLLGGDLGNTLVHSAVGGLGFGAGSAIAGDIVNSIF